jgi:hypothetical protein
VIIADMYTNPEAWGNIVLAGYGPLPGYLVGLKGLVRKHEWVYQKGVGTSGASSIWRGEMIVEEIGIILELPDSASLAACGLLLAAIVPPKGKKPPTFGVSHPMFAVAGVQRISLKSYGIEPSANRSLQLALGVGEYKPTVKAAVGPADPAQLPGAPKPKDAIDKTIDALAATIAAAGK